MARGTRDELVRAARSGDQDAWRELYVRHARRLTVWLASVPSLDAATSPDDLAAQAWLTAASKIGEFTGSDDDFPAWLFGIARNHAVNARRRAVRRRTEPVAVEAGAEAVFGWLEDPVGDVDASDSTRKLLSHLTPRQAQVVACLDVVGLDVGTTAAALDMSPTAVRVMHHRALNRLRTVLARDAPADPAPVQPSALRPEG
jgi:RNA polymerase sigma-70 factor, ECF subfamily